VFVAHALKDGKCLREFSAFGASTEKPFSQRKSAIGTKIVSAEAGTGFTSSARRTLLDPAMQDWRVIVGRNVRRIRQQRRVTQEALAFEAELNLTYVGASSEADGIRAFWCWLE